MAATLPPQVFRVGKTPDAWQRRRPSRGSQPPTHRYDDPLGIYYTIYAASTRYGAYMETLAPLRPSPAVNLTAINENEPGLRSTRPTGQIEDWIKQRHIGEAELRGAFVDLGAASSIAYLRNKLGDRFAAFGIVDFDLSALTSVKREVTMEISRFIHELEHREERRFDGICYPSRLGYNIVCWAVFADSNACLTDKHSHPIDLQDPELKQALSDCEIQLERSAAAS